MMNSLLISNSAKVGGGNRSLLLLGHGLRLRECKVRIVVPAEGQMTRACDAEDLDFEIKAINQPSWRRPDLAWADCRRWKRILRQSNCELVHANDVSTARSVSLAAWRVDVPLVCHIRFPCGPEVTEWAFRRLPKPAAFIFNSHAMQAECGPNFERACQKSKQFVIHNAVDLNQFQPRMNQSEQTHVGILANLSPIKGLADFLRMARLLTDRGIDSEYWVIGDDLHETGYRTELEQLRCQLGLCESVKFLGHRSDIPELLNELDVLVCSSHMETFGRCLIEAMACEKPVVATRVGGIPEVVDDGVTGILVPSKSPEKLADAVSELLNDTELSARMGKAGRMRVEQYFTSNVHADAVLKVYESVLNPCP